MAARKTMRVQTRPKPISARQRRRPWFGIAQNVRDLAVAVQDIYGYEDDSRLDASQINIDHLHAVAEIHTVDHGARSLGRLILAIRKQSTRSRSRFDDSNPVHGLHARWSPGPFSASSAAPDLPLHVEVFLFTILRGRIYEHTDEREVHRMPP
jgi:hypothetical protein